MKKRFCLGIGALLLLLVAQTGIVSASSADDFTVTDFQADYYLDKDAEGRSTLKTVETITAVFPDYDQNHGIERAIPSKYDDHSTSLTIQSITDENNQSVDYTTYKQGNYLVSRIGDANEYAHGSQTYIITYTQRDVTRYFSDTNSDEFYWDINGTDWHQSIDKITARLHLGDNIKTSLTGNMACYYGAWNAINTCEIINSNSVITASTTNLASQENMTISVGFNKQTFTAYQMTFGEKLLEFFIYNPSQTLISFVYILTGVLFIVICFIRMTKGKNAPGRGTIVAEYLPPKNADTALASIVINKPRNWISAMYIDLAVCHKIRIIEQEKKGIFRKATYTLELLSVTNLTETENAVIDALFGNNHEIGSKYEIDLQKPDPRTASKLMDVYKLAKKKATAEGYFLDCKKLRIQMILMTILIAILIFYTAILGLILFVICIFIIVNMKPLSAKGRKLADYLKGLKLYIKIAEEDRIKVLQSPQGAKKTSIDINNKTMLVHLYERVLPYAVLFGQERGWTKVLGVYYVQNNLVPDWYIGSNGFNVASLHLALAGFNNSVFYTQSRNWASGNSNSSSSSSFGGSGGGGFSGGGGGGGGGGGW